MAGPNTRPHIVKTRYDTRLRATGASSCRGNEDADRGYGGRRVRASAGYHTKQKMYGTKNIDKTIGDADSIDAICTVAFNDAVDSVDAICTVAFNDAIDAIDAVDSVTFKDTADFIGTVRTDESANNRYPGRRIGDCRSNIAATKCR